MADWEVENEVPLDEYEAAQGGGRAAAPAPHGGRKWEVESETPAQVHQVQQAAARAPPAPPADTRKTSQLLGAAKGGAGLIDKFWQRAESTPGVSHVLDAASQAFPVVGLARQAERGLIHDRAMPAIAEAEKTHKAGGIGKFIGETLVSAPAYAAGPLLGGALQGFAESDAAPDDMAGLAKDVGFGAAAGKLGDVVGGAVTRKAGDLIAKNAVKFRADKVIPALRKAKNDAYDAVRKSGIVYTPEAVKRLHETMMTTIHNFTDAPGAHGTALAKLRQLETMIKGAPVEPVGPHGPRPSRTPFPATLGELDKLRSEIFDDVVGLGNPEQKELGRRMAKTIDDFTDLATPDDIAVPGGQGMAHDGQRLLGEARDANKRYRNVELVDRKLASAESKTARTYSGGNIDNKVRQVFGPLHDRDSGRNIQRFLHPDSYEQLGNVVEGTPVRNFLRAVGKFHPLGLKGVAAAHLSHGVTIPFTVGSKLIADHSTRKAVSTLMEMIAAGGSKADLATRQLEALAARKSSGVQKWIDATLKDVAETATIAGVREQGNARRDVRSKQYEDVKAAAGR